MTLSIEATNEIKQLIFEFIDNVLKRRVKDEPFDIVKYTEERPFHSALVPEEIWKSSKFERSFVTSLGQFAWEKIARIVGEAKRGFAKTSFKVSGQISEGELSAIQTIVYELEHRVGKEERRRPNWIKEKEEVDKSRAGRLITVEIISDLYVEDKDGNKLYFELKSSKPNADQSRVSKEKMLKIYALMRNEPHETFFALPDNPYGTKENYGHSHPKRFFDMTDTSCVLMGKDFWDKLGGEGTFEELLGVFKDVGKITKERIRREFLNL